MKNVFRAVVVLSLVLSGATALGAAIDNHPEMKAASEAISTAQTQLKAANDHKKTEFGGHRARAISLLTEAEQEIVKAAEYADNPANK